jgi:hypothetical protein
MFTENFSHNTITMALEEKDFSSDLLESVAAIKKDGEVHPDNIFTFHDNTLFIDEISIEQWFRDREEAFDEEKRFDDKIKRRDLVRRNGTWIVKMHVI